LQPSPLEDLHPPTLDPHTAEYIAPVQSGMAALAEKISSAKKIEKTYRCDTDDYILLEYTHPGDAYAS
jgi:hypothetical protein